MVAIVDGNECSDKSELSPSFHTSSVESIENLEDLGGDSTDDDMTILPNSSNDNDTCKTPKSGNFPTRRLAHNMVVPIPPTPSPRIPSKYRVLLADDSIAIRNVLGKILQRGGHEIVTVENGVEALRVLEESSGGKSYDVVILDLHMPVLDGFETMKRIRQREQLLLDTNKQFIIGCSANDDADTILEMKEAGANAFLTKPFTLSQFDECMISRQHPSLGRK